MTLNIDLEDVPFAILEVVKARILANRRKLQNQQQQQRPSLRPRPQFVKIGANSKTWRLPKTAAMVLDESGIAQAWLDYYSTSQATEDRIWRVFSGDGSVYAQGIRQKQYSFSRFLIPTGGSNAILILLTRTVPDYTLNYYGEPLDFAYICGLDKVRQINIPPALDRVLKVLNPPAGFMVDFDNFIPEGVNTSPLPPRQIELSTTGSYDSTTGWADTFFAREWTPRIFQLLNLISPYASSSAFKTYTQQHPLTYDLTTGLHSSLASQDKAWYYAKWLGDPENVVSSNPALFQQLSELTVRPAVWPPSNPDFPYDIDFQGSPAIRAEFMVAWDWDDPDYCRQMCLALGFTAADLQP